ncbi:MAG: glycine zipper 2TM domain-containing protein [Nitrospiraceae bacterium]|nr:glycine zipper 2TM domain-containing protein [Nitrospiraceae bacterium]
MKRFVSIVLFLAFATLLYGCDEAYMRGAGTGAALGGIAGALLDHRNPWRGGVIGGALGAIGGATITDISRRGAVQAADTGQPVEYKTADGRGVYRAEPVPGGDDEGYDDGGDAHTRCKKVRERVWEDGQLVKNRVKEVCEGEKYENRY